MSITIETDYKRAVEVSKAAIGMLEKKVYPFSEEDVFPDAIVPEGMEKGSLNHALFLFYAVSLDRGRYSKTVYKKCRQMWQLLNFAELPNLHESHIRDFLHKHFEKPSSETTFGDPVGTWVTNSQKLQEKYENDPRKLKADTIEKTCKNIREFKGFGTENPWLLTKNYVKAGIWGFPLSELNIKIDRHVINISLGTGVIKVKGVEEIKYNLLVPYLSGVYSEVIKNELISPIELNDALWAIGSYACKENNTLYCMCNCNIKCTTRYPTDKQFTTIQLTNDKRKNAENLFSN